MRLPPTSTSTRMVFAPASMAFSSSSFTTDAGERHRRGREDRSEEHTSELQSQSNLVCRLLLEKKKKRLILCDSLRKSFATSYLHSLLRTHPYALMHETILQTSFIGRAYTDLGHDIDYASIELL